VGYVASNLDDNLRDVGELVGEWRWVDECKLPQLFARS